MEGLAPSALEPAPSQWSSDLLQEARPPQNINFNLNPLRKTNPQTGFLLCRD